MLEKLFTSKARIEILKYFFFFKEVSHLREISNFLNLSSGAVKREIDNLCALNLIIKKGNLLSLNKTNNIINELKQIFLKTDFISFPILNALKRETIKFALIFGSFAKGTDNSESDIDLLIIGDTREDKVYSLLSPVEKIIHREINPIVWQLNQLVEKKNSSFVKDIAKKSFIMILGDKNEFQKFIK